MKRAWVPWLIAAIFAIAFVVVLVANRNVSPNAVNGVTQDSSGRRVVTWIDPMYSQGPPHLYKSNHPGRAPDCGMKLVPQYADEMGTASSGIVISQQRQQLIGVKLAKADVRDLSRTIRTSGRVVVDERRAAQIHAKFEGVVEALYVNFTGQAVQRGQPLLAIYSPDLVATQNELILAQGNRSDLGRTLADAAKTRLRLWDMSAADIDRVAKSGKPMRDVTLRSPVAGVVLQKNALAGARVMPSDTLFEIADLSHVWVLADVYESELPYMRVGSTAQVVVGTQTLPARVTFIGPFVTSQTRTASVRLELDNSAGLLKPDMYADVILNETVGRVIAVPESAVMNTGTRSIVFVARGNGAFEPRQVTTGSHAQGFYEIRSGVSPGETVVVDANFLVDSESRLKSAISQMNGGTP
jgi:RND family efflux transporter MFP subunit